VECYNKTLANSVNNDDSRLCVLWICQILFLIELISLVTDYKTLQLTCHCERSFVLVTYIALFD
jgi:hypothetical protein